jgi:hypothetical protein
MVRTHGVFRAVSVDMALEQKINRSRKSAFGIIGNTRIKKLVPMWELTYHEMLVKSNIFRKLSGISSSLSEKNAISKAKIATGEHKVQAIINTIHRNENPFQLHVFPYRVKVHIILTKEVISDDIRNQLLTVIEIGTKANEALRKEHFAEKSARFSSAIHRVNLRTFLSVHNNKKDSKG